MKRYDLRHLKENFEERMGELINEAESKEALIFIFETILEDRLQKILKDIDAKGHEVLNSLRFNEIDWTIAIRVKGESSEL
ncbi:MAG: NADH-ubiquinone oxidoreductase subunit E family protein [Campylobacteraceae bacterium]